MKCLFCGAENADGNAWCTACGATLTENQRAENDSSEPEKAAADVAVKTKTEEATDSCQNGDSEPPKKKLAKNLVISVAVGAVALIAVIVLICAFSLDSTERAAVDNVSYMIYELGDDISLDSGSAIAKAEEAYAALPKKCQIRVDGYDKLQQARAAYDEKCVENTEKCIDTIGTVTMSDSVGVRIANARKSYDGLSDEQKAKVKNSDVLLDAEQKYAELKVADVEQKIKDIGEVSPEKDCKGKIDAAKTAYDALSNDMQKSVGNAADLESAVQNYRELTIAECIKRIDALGTVTASSEKEINEIKALYETLDEPYRGGVTNYAKLTQAEETLKKQKMSFKLGDTIKTSAWDLTLTKAKIAHSVYPNDTSGYYYYYTAGDGSDFIVLQFKVRNTGSYTMGMDDFVDSIFELEFLGKTVNKTATLYYDDDGWLHPVYSSDGIGSYDTWYINVCFSIPEETKNSDQPVTVTGKFAGQEKMIKLK